MYHPTQPSVMTPQGAFCNSMHAQQQHRRRTGRTRRQTGPHSHCAGGIRAIDAATINTITVTVVGPAPCPSWRFVHPTRPTLRRARRAA
mmetsp:Transcript_41623/g.114631  ORF Transcript_41623/g.114631 Transcript_41623/m.114631 type:complete len:89 (-) Transcript_41623:772-1038(-)